VVTPDRTVARQTPTAPRRWSVEEANARLPAMQELLPQLRGWVVRLGAIHEQSEWMTKFWGKELEAGDNPHHALKVSLEEEWTRLTERLESIVRALNDEGIEIKDLDHGLIDFHARRDGEDVYLCWKDGEAAVLHWHTLEGGYRTRRRLESSGPTSRTVDSH
jgi:hypothetical protein